MVRLLIPLIAIFLIWLLFFSAFSKRIRIILCTGVVLLTALAFWLDMNSRAQRTGLIEKSQLINCGVQGKFSYRSNFNLDLCLRNTAPKATVKKIQVRFDAVSCVKGTCTELQSRTETIHLEIAPGMQLVHTENLSFDHVSPDSQNLLWTAEITKAWASK